MNVVVRRGMTLVIVIVLTGCPKKTSMGTAALDAGAATSTSAPAASILHEHFASPALRCSECHGEIATEWGDSAHARADRSSLFVAMRLGSGVTIDGGGGGGGAGQAASCDGCHAPIRSRVAPDDPVAADAIGCDACHLMTDIVPKREGMGFVLRLDDTTRYAPICDAKNHYFHKMGCSPVHGKSQMCAACHLYYAPSSASPSSPALPVFTEYEEWEKSRHGSVGTECQDCHMPSRVAAVAAGSARVRGLGRHDFKPSLFRSQAIHMKLALEEKTGSPSPSPSPPSSSRVPELEAVVTLINNGAGHSVPTGLPEHRIVLRVQLRDAKGVVAVKAEANDKPFERSYGRILVDDQGREAPFYRAKRVERDTRIGADEQRVERIPLGHVSEAGELMVTLEWQRVAPAIAADLGVALGPSDTATMLSGSLRFDAPRNGRVPLPKPLTVKPSSSSSSSSSSSLPSSSPSKPSASSSP